jgi:GntR family carbon starvation induced transcriptional regulator
MAPGSKVNLDQLRTQHGVSLSPMREAVSRLVAERLMEFEDQRGYRVAPVSRQHLAEVTRLRADLEALALAHAIARGGLDWESGVLAARHRLARGSDPAAHWAFHEALISGCHLPMLTDFCTLLRNHHLRYCNLLKTSAPPAGDHEAIAEAAVSRDADLATALLRSHIERAGAHLDTLFKTRWPSAGADTKEMK